MKFNNQAGQFGGAIYAYGGTLSITHTQFFNNQASQQFFPGGAISAHGKASIQLLNVSFSGNKADGFNCNTKALLSNTHTSMTATYTKTC